jgi:integrase
LAAITTERFDAYLLDKGSLSAKTLANHRTLLRTMLRLAVDRDWLAKVPTLARPRTDPDHEIDPPWLKTSDEIQRFLDAANAEPDPLVGALYVTATYTGMRAGELAGLRWSDVDLARRTVHVRRSYSGKTKTRASRRYVPIVDALLPILITWQRRCPPSADGLVFPNGGGKMHDQSARVFQEVLHRVLDRAGFPRPTHGRSVHYIHFHSLRHTFACHWRLNGGPLEDLVRVLGHTSKAMTEHYANIGGYHRPEHFAIFGRAS